MGVYIPPCSNVEGSINICISNVATVYTTEVLAIPNAYMTALMASLRSICRRNDGDLNAIHLALVFKERTELVEVPRVTSPAERLVTSLGSSLICKVNFISQSYKTVSIYSNI